MNFFPLLISSISWYLCLTFSNSGYLVSSFIRFFEIWAAYFYVGFHVDDSEVTLNVCLGKQFSGGALFFRGVRCDEHVHSESQPEV